VRRPNLHGYAVDSCISISREVVMIPDLREKRGSSETMYVFPSCQLIIDTPSSLSLRCSKGISKDGGGGEDSIEPMNRSQLVQCAFRYFCKLRHNHSWGRMRMCHAALHCMRKRLRRKHVTRHHAWCLLGSTQGRTTLVVDIIRVYANATPTLN
jgi:hypothetical protein